MLGDRIDDFLHLEASTFLPVLNRDAHSFIFVDLTLLILNFRRVSNFSMFIYLVRGLDMLRVVYFDRSLIDMVKKYIGM